MIDPYYIEEAEVYDDPDFEDPEAEEEYMEAVEESDDIEGDAPVKTEAEPEDLSFLDVLDDPDAFAMALAFGDELSQDKVNKKLLDKLEDEADEFVDELMGAKRLSLKDRKNMRSQGSVCPPNVNPSDFYFFKYVRDISTGKKKLGDSLL